MSQNDTPETADAATAPKEVQVDAAHTVVDSGKGSADETSTEETVAGPAEREDPGNDSPATNAPVE